MKYYIFSKKLPNKDRAEMAVFGDSIIGESSFKRFWTEKGWDRFIQAAGNETTLNEILIFREDGVELDANSFLEEIKDLIIT